MPTVTAAAAPIAAVGASLDQIATPALLVCLPTLERNVARLASTAAAHPAIRLRPHAKAFKSGELAQILPYERYCAQTVREAEVLVNTGGVTDVLLTNQIVGANKLARLAALAKDGATIGALVDHPSHVAALDSAATAAGVTLAAYVEVDGGQNRCGVSAGSDAALALAQAIAASPALTMGGLQCYHGAIQHVRDPAERRQLVLEGPVAAAAATVARLAEAGIACPQVSGGGTGTYTFELEGGVHTELQPGSFLFMDGDYRNNEDESDTKFEQSLFVHASVISTNEADGRRVLDAGSKAIDLLCGMPMLAVLPENTLLEALRGVTFSNGGDEHGILNGVPEGLLPVGSTVQLVP